MCYIFFFLSPVTGLLQLAIVQKHLKIQDPWWAIFNNEIHLTVTYREIWNTKQNLTDWFMKCKLGPSEARFKRRATALSNSTSDRINFDLTFERN